MVTIQASARMRRRLSSLLACALLSLWAAATPAKPYIPAGPDVVLERLPAAAELDALAPLRARVAARPRDVAAATGLAQRYIEVSRAHADPRFLGYAGAALAPWRDAAAAPVRVLVLFATIAQTRHHFDRALEILDRALARDPDNGQAWLTKATVLQVQGRLDAARKACGHLVFTSGQLIALTCLAGVDSLAGRLAQSYRRLDAVLQVQSPLNITLRVWTQTILGEMAARMGDGKAAEKHFLNGLAAAPDNIYLQGAYADLLLAQGRDREVVELLRGNLRQDVLLMRLALAGLRLGLPQAKHWADMFAARYAAARRDGNTTHMREQARFVLYARQRPREALALARRDWQVQHEPADVRIVLETALAAGKPAAAQPVLAWIAQTGFEDARIAPLLARLRARTAARDTAR